MGRRKGVRITATGWQEPARSSIAHLRKATLGELDIMEMEDNGADEFATHFLLSRGRRPIGCARLLADGRIDGEAGVGLGGGLGARLLRHIVGHARANAMPRLYLHISGQPESLRYAGFKPCGVPFWKHGVRQTAVALEIPRPRRPTVAELQRVLREAGWRRTGAHRGRSHWYLEVPCLCFGSVRLAIAFHGGPEQIPYYIGWNVRNPQGRPPRVWDKGEILSYTSRRKRRAGSQGSRPPGVADPAGRE